MSVPTIEVSLGDGNAAFIQEYLTRGNRRTIDRHVRERALSDMGQLNETGIDLEKLRAEAATADTETAQVQNDDEDDKLLEVALKGWTLNGEVTNDPMIEDIENLDDRIVNKILVMMHRHYDRSEEDVRNLAETR